MREKAEKPAKRKLTRNQRKQIEAVIRQAKGDGKAHTVQDSIPFQNMFPDGLCRLEGGAFSKTIAFEDVNYRLAGPEDQRSIFESLCDFYNGYDPSIGVQVTLDSRSGGSAADEMFGITRQGNDLDPIRDEAVDILRMQYKRGNNGYVKTKYVTLTIEAENLPAARARFARIETDTLNRFKVMGAAAHVLDGKERLELLYNILHPEGGQFAFEWDWLPASGLSVKDFIAPSSFHFGETRTFRIGKRYRGGVLPANPGAGDARPYPHRLHGGGREYHGDHAHPGHQPERGHQNGQAEDHRPGRHEDTGAEAGGAQRLRYGHTPQRLVYLWRRGERPAHRPAIPQRENVQHDLPGAAHGGDPAKAGDRRIPGGQRRPDLQLPSDPAGLPAGGRADEQLFALGSTASRSNGV